MRKSRLWAMVVALAVVAVAVFFARVEAQGRVPQVPHKTQGYGQCLVCHSAEGTKKLPVSHSGLGLGLCLYCHTPASVPSTEANGPVSQITHGIIGYESCLVCHKTSGIKPAPGTHASLPESGCISCHVVSPASRIPTPSPDAACLVCHGQPGLSLSFASGEKLELYVDRSVFESSIHGDKLLCTGCHRTITSYPHPKLEARDRAEYHFAQYEVCKQCHFDNYTKTLDGVHYDLVAGGNSKAPICSDCHGAHDVKPLRERSVQVFQTCARCHAQVYSQYAASVHGRALFEEGNKDVPACNDCHVTHATPDPRTAAFRVASVDICARCHSNRTLMEKYGISTKVVKTYLADFHGVTTNVIKRQKSTIWAKEAVCTDCHGVHDIKKVDDNANVIKSNLVSVCQKCHPDATTNFPSAWLSHYEPSMTKSPAVFYVRWFYRLLIPFMMVGLGIHVLIDLRGSLKLSIKKRNGGRQNGHS